jgi:hypothetical protein
MTAAIDGAPMMPSKKDQAAFERFRNELLSCKDVAAAHTIRVERDLSYAGYWGQVHRIIAGSPFTGDAHIRETIAEWIRRCEENHKLDPGTAVKMRMCLYPN